MLKSILNQIEKKTVRTKLFIGFSIISCFTLIIGGISIYAYQILAKDTHWLYFQSTLGVSSAQTLRADLNSFNSDVGYLLLNSGTTKSDRSSSGADKILAHINQIKINIKNDLVELDKTVSRPVVRAAFDEVNQNVDRYFTLMDQVLILNKASNAQAIQALMDPELQALQNKIFTPLN